MHYLETGQLQTGFLSKEAITLSLYQLILMANPFVKNFILAQQAELLCSGLTQLHSSSEEILCKVEDAQLLLNNGCIVESLGVLQEILYSESFGSEVQAKHKEMIQKGLKMASEIHSQIGNTYIMPYLVGLQLESFFNKVPVCQEGNPFEMLNPFGLADLTSYNLHEF